MKKVKLIAGLCLIGQSMLFFILFLVYWNKSKSLARTLAVFSAVGGVAGAWLVVKQLSDRPGDEEDPLDPEDDLDGDFLEEAEEYEGDISCAFGSED